MRTTHASKLRCTVIAFRHSRLHQEPFALCTMIIACGSSQSAEAYCLRRGAGETFALRYWRRARSPIRARRSIDIAKRGNARRNSPCSMENALVATREVDKLFIIMIRLEILQTTQVTSPRCWAQAEGKWRPGFRRGQREESSGRDRGSRKWTKKDCWCLRTTGSLGARLTPRFCLDGVGFTQNQMFD